MGSPSSSSSCHDWLELGLGLIKTTKKQQQLKEEEEKEEEECLDLRLQIGPKNKNNNHVHNNNNNNLIINTTTTEPHLQYNFHAISSISPNSALWFSLRSSPNRKSGSALPQIPKAYIRVKDEKMTVLMVKKYLVTKLSLSSEAEVELWCMGERLVQSQSLKEVRDGVWLPKLVEFLNSNSSFSTSIFHHSFHHHHHHHPSNQVFSPSSSTITTTTTAYLMSLYYGRT